MNVIVLSGYLTLNLLIGGITLGGTIKGASAEADQASSSRLEFVN